MSSPAHRGGSVPPTMPPLMPASSSASTAPTHVPESDNAFATLHQQHPPQLPGQRHGDASFSRAEHPSPSSLRERTARDDPDVDMDTDTGDDASRRSSPRAKRHLHHHHQQQQSSSPMKSISQAARIDWERQVASGAAEFLKMLSDSSSSDDDDDDDDAGKEQGKGKPASEKDRSRTNSRLSIKDALKEVDRQFDDDGDDALLRKSSTTAPSSSLLNAKASASATLLAPNDSLSTLTSLSSQLSPLTDLSFSSAGGNTPHQLNEAQRTSDAPSLGRAHDSPASSSFAAAPSATTTKTKRGSARPAALRDSDDDSDEEGAALPQQQQRKARRSAIAPSSSDMEEDGDVTLKRLSRKRSTSDNSSTTSRASGRGRATGSADGGDNSSARDSGFVELPRQALASRDDADNDDAAEQEEDDERIRSKLSRKQRLENMRLAAAAGAGGAGTASSNRALSAALSDDEDDHAARGKSTNVKKGRRGVLPSSENEDEDEDGMNLDERAKDHATTKAHKSGSALALARERERQAREWDGDEKKKSKSKRSKKDKKQSHNKSHQRAMAAYVGAGLGSDDDDDDSATTDDSDLNSSDASSDASSASERGGSGHKKVVVNKQKPKTKRELAKEAKEREEKERAAAMAARRHPHLSLEAVQKKEVRVGDWAAKLLSRAAGTPSTSAPLPVRSSSVAPLPPSSLPDEISTPEATQEAEDLAMPLSTYRTALPPSSSVVPPSSARLFQQRRKEPTESHRPLDDDEELPDLQQLLEQRALKIKLDKRKREAIARERSKSVSVAPPDSSDDDDIDIVGVPLSRADLQSQPLELDDVASTTPRARDAKRMYASMSGVKPRKHIPVTESQLIEGGNSHFDTKTGSAARPKARKPSANPFRPNEVARRVASAAISQQGMSEFLHTRARTQNLSARDKKAAELARQARVKAQEDQNAQQEASQQQAQQPLNMAALMKQRKERVEHEAEDDESSDGEYREDDSEEEEVYSGEEDPVEAGAGSEQAVDHNNDDDDDEEEEEEQAQSEHGEEHSGSSDEDEKQQAQSPSSPGGGAQPLVPSNVDSQALEPTQLVGTNDMDDDAIFARPPTPRKPTQHASSATQHLSSETPRSQVDDENGFEEFGGGYQANADDEDGRGFSQFFTQPDGADELKLDRGTPMRPELFGTQMPELEDVTASRKRETAQLIEKHGARPMEDDVMATPIAPAYMERKIYINRNGDFTQRRPADYEAEPESPGTRDFFRRDYSQFSPSQSQAQDMTPARPPPSVRDYDPSKFTDPRLSQWGETQSQIESQTSHTGSKARESQRESQLDNVAEEENEERREDVELPQEGSDASDADESGESDHEQERPTKSAFDLMNQGAAQEEKEHNPHRPKNQFIEHEANLSEDEDGLSESGDEDEAGLNRELKELVDNQVVDEEVEFEQDQLAQKRYQADMEEDELRAMDKAQRIAKGQLRRNRGNALTLQDDEDDDGLDDDRYGLSMRHRSKRRKLDATTAALLENPETQAFAKESQVMHDEDQFDVEMLQGEPEPDSDAEEDDEERQPLRVHDLRAQLRERAAMRELGGMEDFDLGQSSSPRPQIVYKDLTKREPRPVAPRKEDEEPGYEFNLKRRAPSAAPKAKTAGNYNSRGAANINTSISGASVTGWGALAKNNNKAVAQAKKSSAPPNAARAKMPLLLRPMGDRFS